MRPQPQPQQLAPSNPTSPSCKSNRKIKAKGREKKHFPVPRALLPNSSAPRNSAAAAAGSIRGSSEQSLAPAEMSTKITVTYKRKHGASKARAADGVVPEPPPVSSSGVSSSEAPKREADVDNSMLNGGDSFTSTQQQDACKLMQQCAKRETAKPCAHAPEKEHKEIQLCESLPRMEQPEVSCATSLPVAEACNIKLQCTNDAFNPIPSPSYVCDLRHDDGTKNQPEDSNNSAPARISYHQVPDDTSRHRFSPLLTFRRRVKRKINLDEPAEEGYSKDNGKLCSVLTGTPPSLLVNAIPLLNGTDGNSLDTAHKVTIAGTSSGLTVPAKCLLEQKSSCMLKSTVQHTFSPQHAEDVDQSLNSERDGTPVSEFTSVREISTQDVRAEDLSKTVDHVTEAPEVVEIKELHGNGLLHIWQGKINKFKYVKTN